MTSAPVCPYCGQDAELRPSTEIYTSGKDYGWLWVCKGWPACDAYVGCHPGTQTPLGGLADRNLRVAKMAAHAAFDRLWQAKAARGDCSRSKARGLGYAWLAEQMQIPPGQCHIGMMTTDQCWKIVGICRKYHNSRKTP